MRTRAPPLSHPKARSRRLRQTVLATPTTSPTHSTDDIEAWATSAVHREPLRSPNWLKPRPRLSHTNNKLKHRRRTKASRESLAGLCTMQTIRSIPWGMELHTTSAALCQAVPLGPPLRQITNFAAEAQITSKVAMEAIAPRLWINSNNSNRRLHQLHAAVQAFSRKSHYLNTHRRRGRRWTILSTRVRSMSAALTCRTAAAASSE